jgi:hypothetical protein
MWACALMIAGAGAAYGQTGDMNLPVYFTFSQPVALPRTTLPAGKYLFKLVDSNTTRTVVQVSSADGKRQVGFFMTVPVQRNQAPNDPEIRFLEAPANAPTAVATYWYPGRKQGWEFVYPRSEAMKLAQSSKQSVLTTVATSDASNDDMKNAPLARVSASGDQATVGNDAAEVSVSGNSARGEIADANAPAMTVAQNDARPPAPSAPRTRLPQTAGTTPLVVLIGGLLLCAGLVLRVWTRLAV